MDKSLKICVCVRVCAYRDWQWFNPLIADYTNDKSCTPIMVNFQSPNSCMQTWVLDAQGRITVVMNL